MAEKSSFFFILTISLLIQNQILNILALNRSQKFKEQQYRPHFSCPCVYFV
jgi:hypothetical protein